MTKKTNRRDFNQSVAALGAGAWVLGGVSLKPSLSANEEIRFGCIGVGGKGASDSTAAGRNGKVVAMCDIDEEILGKKKSEFGDAKTYYDFRKMLDEMGDMPLSLQVQLLRALEENRLRPVGSDDEIEPRTDYNNPAKSTEQNEECSVQSGPLVGSPSRIDHVKYRRHFVGASGDVIKKTFKNTTQLG